MIKGNNSLFNTVLGKLDIHIQKKEIGPLFHIILKNQLKKYYRSIHKPETAKFTEEKLLDIDLGSGFLDMTPGAQAT